jgi:hypothetical protein
MYCVISLFCEDIREEKAGTVTIIGIYTDNITVTVAPFNFAKLAVYTRISFPVTAALPKAIALRLIATDGKEVALASFDQGLIAKAQKESLEKGAANAGLIGSAVLVPFTVRQPGRMNVVAKIKALAFFPSACCSLACDLDTTVAAQ